MKRRGVVQRGAYQGQRYVLLRTADWPRWTVVELTDECGDRATREVREEFLEYEW